MRSFKSFPFYVFRLCALLKSYLDNLHYFSIAEINDKAKLLPGARIINMQKNRSAITVRSNTRIHGSLLVFAHSGLIEIGESCYVGENSRIWSASKVEIGNRVLISHNVNIHDTDSHPLDKQERAKHARDIFETGHPKDNLEIPSSPIRIHDDVWIGFNVTILKGVTIGEGSIIGASSVVTSDVPSNTVCVGNPARCIRKVFHESN